MPGWCDSEPRLLAKDGQFLPEAMKDERITEDELISAVRANGGSGIEEVAFLVLESDGSLSVSLKG